MSAMTGTGMVPTRSGGCLFRRRLTSRSDVKRTPCAGRSQNDNSRRPRRSAMPVLGMAPTRSVGGRFRCRLTSLSDVKAAAAAGRNQNRQLMRGGRT